jgi:hypothetical protein
MTTAEPVRLRAAESGSATAAPPYAFAVVAFVVVLAGYVVSLAPTVTFWDAGEFIASAHILGIPHPPGTPVFVVLGRVWDMMLGSLLTTAVTTNLMAATFSALSAAFLFLLMHEALRAGSKGLDEGTAKIFRIGGALAATLIAAFTFTVWQNSNETEVYQVAMFTIGAMGWMCWLWRRDRGGVKGAHIALLLVYCMGVTLGNHLMALLCGPAVLAFMFHVLRTQPAKSEVERAVQWSQFAVTTTMWITLVGMGTGQKGIIVVGLVLYLLAAVWAFRSGAGLFAVMSLVVAAVGASTYAILFVRAGLHPFISEADPSTFQNLWSVIRREQYPPRSPLDNPMYPNGLDNPGRTLQIFGLQILNYLQYFDWQFAAALQKSRTLLAPARLPFTLLFTALGIWGATEHRKWDRSSFWFVMGLFATTSIGLVLYLNFKPGFSIGYEYFPDRELHEVRERDYFYTVSFVAFGLWCGLGLAAAYRALRERLGGASAWLASPVLLVALLPFLLNFGAASRRHGPTATLPRDFAYDMLIGVEPYGLLFTNGDNDTFPLWYLQEVEKVRQDVMVVNLSLINTDWYIRQLRDNEARPYEPDSNAVRLFGRDAGPPPSCSAQQLDSLNAWADRAHRRRPDLSRGRPMCLHTLNDDQVAAIQPQLLADNFHFVAGNIAHDFAAGTPMYVKDVMVLRLIQENLGKRPIFWALTAGTGNRMGLDRYITQQGIAFKLHADTVAVGPDRVPGLFNSVMDVERTRVLAWDVFRYARLFEATTLDLDPTDDNIAGNLAFIFMSLGDAYRQQGDIARMVENYTKANHLSHDPRLQEFLQQLQAAGPALPGLETPPADSAKQPAARGGGGRDSAKRR